MRDRQLRRFVASVLFLAGLIGALAITDPRGTPHAWPVPVDWAGILLIGLMIVFLLLPWDLGP